MKLAIFDFDGTITSKDSFNDFLIFVFGKKRFIFCMLLNSPFILLYLLNIIKNNKIKEKMFKHFYKGEKYEKYKFDCERYYKLRLKEILRKDIVEKISNYKKENVELIILSASFKEYIELWANEYNFSKVICTSFEIDDNFIIDGTILEKNSCHGENKLTMLKKYYPNLEKYYTYGYGDSKSDMYFLRVMDEKYIVK